MKLNINKNSWPYLIICHRNNGFTLTELLVVVIIFGILSAIGLPSLINQVGKARETEAKSNLGIIVRAQQAYHYEHQSFYNGNNIDLFADVNMANSYYQFTGDSSADQNKALHTAYADTPTESKARDFAAGVYFNSPNYSQTICIANTLDNDGTSSSVNVQTDGSCNSGSQIR